MPIAGRRKRSRSCIFDRRTCTSSFWVIWAIRSQRPRSRAPRRKHRADPRGGPPPIDIPDIASLLDAVGTRSVVPMHFKTRKINLNIKPVIIFLEVLLDIPVIWTGATSLDKSRYTLPERQNVIALDDAR